MAVTLGDIEHVWETSLDRLVKISEMGLGGGGAKSRVIYGELRPSPMSRARWVASKCYLTLGCKMHGSWWDMKKLVLSPVDYRYCLLQYIGSQSQNLSQIVAVAFWVTACLTVCCASESQRQLERFLIALVLYHVLNACKIDNLHTQGGHNVVNFCVSSSWYWNWNFLVLTQKKCHHFFLLALHHLLPLKHCFISNLSVAA